MNMQEADPEKHTFRERTISDFGAQWTRFTGNEGFYGSQDLWRDVVGPLLEQDAFRDKRIVDIGSGTGRIVKMLVEAGAAHVTAIEPSEGYRTLVANVKTLSDRVQALNVSGEAIPPHVCGLDWATSIGVLHHIPDPLPVLLAARRALRPGGRLLVWVYGREGNGAYLALVQPLRALTTRLPSRLVEALAWAMTVPLSVYAWLCRLLPFLPLAAYMNWLILRLTWQKRMLVIYDQLAPRWAEYYTRERVVALLTAAGFLDTKLHHRHGYSWTAIATNPG